MIKFLHWHCVCSQGLPKKVFSYLILILKFKPNRCNIFIKTSICHRFKIPTFCVTKFTKIRYMLATTSITCGWFHFISNILTSTSSMYFLLLRCLFKDSTISWIVVSKSVVVWRVPPNESAIGLIECRWIFLNYFVACVTWFHTQLHLFRKHSVTISYCFCSVLAQNLQSIRSSPIKFVTI